MFQSDGCICLCSLNWATQASSESDWPLPSPVRPVPEQCSKTITQLKHGVLSIKIKHIQLDRHKLTETFFKALQDYEKSFSPHLSFLRFGTGSCTAFRILPLADVSAQLSAGPTPRLFDKPPVLHLMEQTPS